MVLHNLKALLMAKPEWGYKNKLPCENKDHSIHAECPKLPPNKLLAIISIQFKISIHVF